MSIVANYLFYSPINKSQFLDTALVLRNFHVKSKVYHTKDRLNSGDSRAVMSNCEYVTLGVFLTNALIKTCYLHQRAFSDSVFVECLLFNLVKFREP